MSIAEEGSSEYVYRDEDNGDDIIVDIGFGCEDCEHEMIEPTIDRVFDINEQYSFQNMTNSTVEYKGGTFFGRFPTILDKASGKLYPIVLDGKPIEFDADMEIPEPFYSNDEYSTTIADGGIYTDHLKIAPFVTGALHKLVLDEENAFIAVQITPDNAWMNINHELLVNDRGHVITMYETMVDGKRIKQWSLFRNGVEIPLPNKNSTTLPKYHNWHILGGEFAYAFGDELEVLTVKEWLGETPTFERTGTFIDNREPNVQIQVAVQRGECKMNREPQVVCLEDKSEEGQKQWVVQDDFVSNGFDHYDPRTKLMASDNILYAIHTYTDDNNHSAKIAWYDTSKHKTGSTIDTGLYTLNDETQVIGMNVVDEHTVRIYKLVDLQNTTLL